MLYADVAGRIEGLIEEGALRPGDRVPSVRKLSKQQDVSISTVLQAYSILESKGLIEARPQSGYYVRPGLLPVPQEPRMCRPARAPVRVQRANLALRIFEAERKGILAPLASALPAPELFPTQGLMRALSRAGRRLGPAVHAYEHVPGYLPLRRQIARRSLESGCSLSPDEVIITVGAMEALNLCLRAVARPGDTIAIESPTYFGILQAMESLGLRALEIPAHPRDGMDVDALKAALARTSVKAVVAMPNFNNPMGSMMPDGRKQELVEFLARADIPLIEDDIYGDLPVGDERPRAAKAYDTRGNVLLCSSFSKSLSPGARVGWVAPGRFFDEVQTLKFMNTIATATVMQAGVAEFLSSGGYDRHLRRLRVTFAQQVDRVCDAVVRHFPSGTRLTRPSGGFVVWVELPRGVDALELEERAAAERIRFAPGPMFSARDSFPNFLRLNCGHPFTERTDLALRILGRLAREMAA
ncbi:MAG: PLP-dependent aminotransferase family protein [Myxococcota bacterium]